MKRTILSILFMWAGTLLYSQDISGSWSGRAEVGFRKMAIVFDIERTAAGYGAVMTSPDQGNIQGAADEVVLEGDTLRIVIRSIDFSFTGLWKNDKIEGAIRQRGNSFPVTLERGALALNRPQHPVPPFPYNSEEIFFDNEEAGIRLAGTLTWPAEGTGFPAVVMITGSGQQDRDETIMGHKPFLVIADHFARKGIAVLRFNDRGFAQSEGDVSTATSADFATDAFAAVRYLQSRPEIAPSKIGLAGHSEGGSIAFITASEHPGQIAFVISMAGPGVRGDSISVMQMEDLMLGRGMSPQAAKTVAEKQRRDLDFIYSHPPAEAQENLDDLAAQIVPGYQMLDEENKDRLRKQLSGSLTPWSYFFMKHDPAPNIRATRCPVLVVNGGTDIQVRLSVNLAAICSALREGGNSDIKITEYPGLNHFFQHSETGAIEEYGDIEETLSAEVIEDMAEWIISVTR